MSGLKAAVSVPLPVSAGTWDLSVAQSCSAQPWEMHLGVSTLLSSKVCPRPPGLCLARCQEGPCLQGTLREKGLWGQVLPPGAHC